jgi:hypothetical protein
MNEETFKVRAYGFGELAQLYFPEIARASASIQLKRWICENDELMKNLKSKGYKTGKKILTPIMVGFIIEEFGIP